MNGNYYESFACQVHPEELPGYLAYMAMEELYAEEMANEGSHDTNANGSDAAIAWEPRRAKSRA